MSTAYYPFRNTISSVQLTESPEHDFLGVWQQGAKIGELTVTKGTGKTVIMLFVSEVPAFRVTYGGLKEGTVVSMTERARDMKRNEYLLSELGELFTVDQVLSLGGRGCTGDTQAA